jgi:predicted RNA-binding Zn-ribbon protein involved in translation (DUF1610 family)
MSEQTRAIAQGELGELAQEALRRWQQEHPRATLDEIVAAVDTVLAPMRAQYIHDLAQAQEAALLVERRCPECGGQFQQRGRATREVLIPGQGQATRLERAHLVCSSCGTSLFPPR